MPDRIDQIISFLKEIDKYKTIERKIWCTGSERTESDAEHAWHIAMFVMLFDKDLPENLDRLKMLKLALIHDLVEIYAGDIFIFDKDGRKNKKDREEKAAKILFSQLPDDLQKEFEELYKEYEAKETDESRFVHSFDKIQPILQNIITKGKTWRKFNVKYSALDDYKRKHVTHSNLTKKIYEKIMEEALNKNLFPED